MLEHKAPVFGPSYRTTLLYSLTGQTLTSSSGVIANYIFTANGLYDPDISGIGHQPMAFDQLMLFFEQYTVINSRIRIECLNNTPAANSMVRLYVSPDASPLTDPQRIVENGLLVQGLVSSNTNAHLFLELELSCDIRKYFGRNSPREMVNDPDVSGNSGANPVEQVYYIISLLEFTQGGTTSIAFNATLSFDVIFHEPRKLTTS
jgi:hypothetical protein